MRASPRRHLARDQVHGKIREGEPGRLGRIGAAPDQRLHARQKLGKGKGLGQVVVRAGLKTFHAVFHRALGAQHDDRGLHLLAAHGLDQLEPVQLGQHDVYDRRRVGLGQGEVEALLAVGRVVDRKPFGLQAFQDEGGDFGVVFDEQYAHGSGSGPIFDLVHHETRSHIRIRNVPKARIPLNSLTLTGCRIRSAWRYRPAIATQPSCRRTSTTLEVRGRQPADDQVLVLLDDPGAHEDPRRGSAPAGCPRAAPG